MAFEMIECQLCGQHLKGKNDLKGHLAGYHRLDFNLLNGKNNGGSCPFCSRAVADQFLLLHLIFYHRLGCNERASRFLNRNEVQGFFSDLRKKFDRKK